MFYIGTGFLRAPRTDSWAGSLIFRRVRHRRPTVWGFLQPTRGMARTGDASRRVPASLVNLVLACQELLPRRPF